MCFSGKFKIGPFDNGIDGAGLLALLLLLLLILVVVDQRWFYRWLVLSMSMQVL